ncbi:MAG: hypothetical protein A07HR60_01398 [uncultured archaeon A07HR60]|nr:MAG: hypothetical protein A07HR60_01398 [uncultured archaeon A07HR60]
MTSTREKIRQLAPHWAVMFVLMFALIAAAEAVVGSLPFWQSFIVIVVTAIAYPTAVRYLGFAPAVWQNN